MDVSGDILVWTDNIIEPRTTLISKSIAGVLNVALSNWTLSQARRAPVYAPLFNIVDDEYAPDLIAEDGEKQPTDFATPPVQFTTSYTLWDDSETRPGAFSQAWSNRKVRLYVHPEESEKYLLASLSPIIPSTFVKAVNFYYRRGNAGVWLLLERKENVQSNYIAISGFRTISVDINDLRRISGSSVTPADFRSFFDAVPITAKQNLFAGRRLHYLSFKDNFDAVPCTMSAVSVARDELADWSADKFRTILVETDYEFGVAAFDANGKRTTILQTLSYKSGAFSELAIMSNDLAVSTRDFSAAIFGVDDIDSKNTYALTLQAQFPQVLPQWVDNIRFFAKQKLFKKLVFMGIARVVVVYSKFDIATGVKEYAYGNFLPFGDLFINEAITYNFEGLGFYLDQNIPFNYSSETQYELRIKRHFTFEPEQDPLGRQLAFSDMEKIFSVFDFRDGYLFCKIKQRDLDLFYSANYFDNSYTTGGSDASKLCYLNFPGEDSYYPSFNQAFSEVELSIIGNEPETFYQIGEAIPAAGRKTNPGEVFELLWTGDAYITKIEKGETGPVRQKFPTNEFYPGGVSMTDSIRFEYWTHSMNLCGPYIEQWDSDFGQVNVYAPSTQIVRNKPNAMRHSETKIQGTAINGFFTVQEENEIEMALEFGEITRGFPGSVDAERGNRIRVVCQNGCISVYLDRTVLQNQDGTSNLIQSTLVYGSQNPMKDRWGAALMKHCVLTSDGLIFFISETQKTLVQWSENGLIDIPRGASDRFVSAISKMGDYTNTVLGFDPYYKEIIIFSSPGSMAYNYEQNAFQGFRSYDTFGAERATALWLTMGTRVFLFEYSKVYEQNLSDDDGNNTLCGLPFGAEFTVVSNSNPQVGKTFKRIRFKGEIPWSARIRTDTIKEYDPGQFSPQETTTLASEFSNVKGIWVGSIYADINGVNGGKFKGKDMEGYLAEILFSTDSPKVTSFEVAEIGFFVSTIQKR
jgi:hypothetical protein